MKFDESLPSIFWCWWVLGVPLLFYLNQQKSSLDKSLKTRWKPWLVPGPGPAMAGARFAVTGTCACDMSLWSPVEVGIGSIAHDVSVNKVNDTNKRSNMTSLFILLLWLFTWYHFISLANVRPSYIEYYIPNYIITFTHTYICILWTIWISNIDTSVDETSYHHDVLPTNPLGPQHALLFVALLHFVPLLLINML